MIFATFCSALLVSLAGGANAAFDAAKPCSSVQASLTSPMSNKLSAVLHVQSSETTLGSKLTIKVTANSAFSAVTLNGQLYEFPASTTWAISQNVDCAGMRIVDFIAAIDFRGQSYSGQASKTLGCACSRRTKFCADTAWVLWDNQWPGSQVGSMIISSKEARSGSMVTLDINMGSKPLQKVVVNGYPYTPVNGKVILEGPIACNGLQVLWLGVELQLADSTSILTAANKGIGCACNVDKSRPCKDYDTNLYDYNDLSIVLGHVNIHSTKEGKDATEYRVQVEAAPGQQITHIVYNGVDMDPISPTQFAITEQAPCNGYQMLVFQVETHFLDGHVSYLAAFKSIGCRCVDLSMDCKPVSTPLVDLYDFSSSLGSATIDSKESRFNSEITVNVQSNGKLMTGIVINDYYWEIVPTMQKTITLDKVVCVGLQWYWLGIGAYYEDGSFSVSATPKDIGCKCAHMDTPLCGATEVNMWKWTYPAAKVGTLKITSRESIIGSTVSMALDTEPSYSIIAVLLNEEMLAVEHKNHVNLDVAPVSCPRQLIIYPVGIQLEDYSWSLMAAAKWVGCECPN